MSFADEAAAYGEGSRRRPSSFAAEAAALLAAEPDTEAEALSGLKPGRTPSTPITDVSAVSPTGLSSLDDPARQTIDQQATRPSGFLAKLTGQLPAAAPGSYSYTPPPAWQEAKRADTGTSTLGLTEAQRPLGTPPVFRGQKAPPPPQVPLGELPGMAVEDTNAFLVGNVFRDAPAPILKENADGTMGLDPDALMAGLNTPLAQAYAPKIEQDPKDGLTYLTLAPPNSAPGAPGWSEATRRRAYAVQTPDGWQVLSGEARLHEGGALARGRLASVGLEPTSAGGNAAQNFAYNLAQGLPEGMTLGTFSQQAEALAGKPEGLSGVAGRGLGRLAGSLPAWEAGAGAAEALGVTSLPGQMAAGGLVSSAGEIKDLDSAARVAVSSAVLGKALEGAAARFPEATMRGWAARWATVSAAQTVYKTATEGVAVGAWARVAAPELFGQPSKEDAARVQQDIYDAALQAFFTHKPMVKDLSAGIDEMWGPPVSGELPGPQGKLPPPPPETLSLGHPPPPDVIVPPLSPEQQQVLDDATARVLARRAQIRAGYEATRDRMTAEHGQALERLRTRALDEAGRVYGDRHQVVTLIGEMDKQELRDFIERARTLTPAPVPVTPAQPAQGSAEVAGAVPPAWEIFKAGDTTIIRNPSDADYADVIQQFKEDNPRAPVGTVKVRSTLDAEGNKYIWQADKGSHADIEPRINAKFGTKTNQNGHFDVETPVPPAPQEEALAAVEPGRTGEVLPQPREVVPGGGEAVRAADVAPVVPGAEAPAGTSLAVATPQRGPQPNTVYLAGSRTAEGAPEIIDAIPYDGTPEDARRAAQELTRRQSPWADQKIWGRAFRATDETGTPVLGISPNYEVVEPLTSPQPVAQDVPALPSAAKPDPAAWWSGLTQPSRLEVVKQAGWVTGRGTPTTYARRVSAQPSWDALTTYEQEALAKQMPQPFTGTAPAPVPQEEIPHAVEEGNQPQGRVGEHRGDDGGRAPAEAGGRGLAAPGGQGPEAVGQEGGGAKEAGKGEEVAYRTRDPEIIKREIATAEKRRDDKFFKKSTGVPPPIAQSALQGANNRIGKMYDELEAAEAERAKASKQSWQMTREEYAGPQEFFKGTDQPKPAHTARAMEHFNAVREALAAGKPVPAEVLADYPNLTQPEGTPHGQAEDVSAVRQADVEVQGTRREGEVADTFLADATPMARGRAIKALEQRMRFNGVEKSRAQAVNERVEAGGARVEEAKEGRRFYDKDDNFLSEKDIGSTAMDYAEHLLAPKAPAKAVTPEPPVPGIAGTYGEPVEIRTENRPGEYKWLPAWISSVKQSSTGKTLYEVYTNPDNPQATWRMDAEKVRPRAEEASDVEETPADPEAKATLPEGWNRTTDLKGSKAREVLQAQVDAAEARVQELNPKLNEAERQHAKTRRGSNKRSELGGKIARLREQQSAISREVQGQRDELYRAFVEDVAEEGDAANSLAARAKLVDLAGREKNRTWSLPWAKMDEGRLAADGVKKLALEEAKRQGVEKKFRDTLALEVTSSIMAYPGVRSLRETVETTWSRQQADRRVSEGEKIINALQDIDNYHKTQALTEMRLANYQPEKWQEAIDKARRLDTQAKEMKAAGEKRAAEEAAAKKKAEDEAKAERRAKLEEAKNKAGGVFVSTPEPDRAIAAGAWGGGATLGHTENSVRAWLRRFVEATPEFKKNPVFFVAEGTGRRGSRMLVFKDGYTFHIEPAMFNLNVDALEPGDKVRVDLAEWFNEAEAPIYQKEAPLVRAARDAQHTLDGYGIWGGGRALIGGKTPGKMRRMNASKPTVEMIRNVLDWLDLAGRQPAAEVQGRVVGIAQDDKGRPMDTRLVRFISGDTPFFVDEDAVDFISANAQGPVRWSTVPLPAEKEESKIPFAAVVAYEGDTPVGIFALDAAPDSIQGERLYEHKKPKKGESPFWSMRTALEEGLEKVNADADGTETVEVPAEADTAEAPAPAETPTAEEPTAEEPMAEPEEDASATEPGIIEDFGEVLHGARKMYAAAYADKMRLAEDVDVSAEPLSKSWPEPDYAKLLEGGADPWTVAFVRAARDQIPTKPQRSWKLQQWAGQVHLLRGFANELLAGKITKEKVQEYLGKPDFKLIRDAVGGRADLYVAVGHERSLKGIALVAGNYSFYKGKEYKPSRIIWTVEQKTKATALSNWPRQIAEGDTREAAIEAFKAKVNTLEETPRAAKAVKFTIYGKRGETGFWIGRKIGSTYLDIKHFDDVKEARAYTHEHPDELEALLEKYRNIPYERKATNAPRVGIDHRDGADVTPQAFSEAFGFRGVQFGNYVEGPRRQADLNEAYDALMDLAGILDVPAAALSLNGELGLAFGARGHGGKNAPSAHYEPGLVVINLTKGGGAGSLAHEWWHAVDNYFSRARGRSNEYLFEHPYPKGEGVRPEMVQAFREVVDAINRTGLRERAKELDKRRTKDYWSTGREMAARAFESYVIAKLADQGASNDYLSNIVSQETFGIENGYPYPTAAEIPAVRASFDHLFNTIESKQTEKGTALYQIRGKSPLRMTPTEYAAHLAELSKVPVSGRAAGLESFDDVPDVTPDPARKPSPPGRAARMVEAVRAVVADLKAPVPVNVVVMASAKDAPFFDEMSRRDPKLAKAPHTVGGAFVRAKDGAPATIYLFTDGAADVQEVLGSLAHEYVGHFGLRATIGDAESKALDAQLLDLYKNGPADLKKIVRERGYGEATEEEQVKFGEEMLAAEAEKDSARPPWYERLIGWLRRQLRAAWRRITGHDLGITREDVRSWLRDIKRNLDAGGETPGFTDATLGTKEVSGGAEAGMLAVNPDVELAPTWYSKLDRAAAKGPGKASVADWRRFLEGKGVPKAEIEWRMAGLDPAASMTKAEMVQHLAANEVRVEEVVKGDREGDFSREDAYRLWYEDMLAGKKGEYSEREKRDMALLVQVQGYQGLDVWVGDLSEYAPEGGKPKFSAYKTPGGENYREVLLTLPTPQDSARLDELREMDSRTPAEEAEFQRELARAAPSGYLSSHWDEPNVLAHVRLQDFTDAAGKRVLLVEEIQSDWHQEGRKKGYQKQGGKIERQTIQGEEGNTSTFRLEGVDGEIQVFPDPYGRFNVDRIVEGKVTRERQGLSELAAIDAAEFILRLASKEGVPDAPFKDTDRGGWVDLSLKRILRMAAEEGYDRVAWVPGEAQAERYDLSKQISRITYQDNSARGAGRASMEGEPSSGTLTAWDLNDRQVLDERLADPAKAEDFIGKEAAAKLFQAPARRGRDGTGWENRTRELSGLDLKVGGEGMRGFYDRIVPAAVSRLTKQYGVRVGETSLTVGDEEQVGPSWEHDERGEWAVMPIHDTGMNGEPQAFAWFATSEEAQAFSDEWNAGGAKAFPSFDVTPALRSAALHEGFPMFQIRTLQGQQAHTVDALLDELSAFAGKPVDQVLSDRDILDIRQGREDLLGLAAEVQRRRDRKAIAGAAGSVYATRPSLLRFGVSGEGKESLATDHADHALQWARALERVDAEGRDVQTDVDQTLRVLRTTGTKEDLDLANAIEEGYEIYKGNRPALSRILSDIGHRIDAFGQKALKSGIITRTVDVFDPRSWTPPEERKGFFGGQPKFSQTTKHAKERTFPTALDAVRAGYRPKLRGLSNLWAQHVTDVGKALNDRETVRVARTFRGLDVTDANGNVTKGLPFFATTKELKGDHGYVKLTHPGFFVWEEVGFPRDFEALVEGIEQTHFLAGGQPMPLDMILDQIRQSDATLGRRIDRVMEDRQWGGANIFVSMKDGKLRTWQKGQLWAPKEYGDYLNTIFKQGLFTGDRAWERAGRGIMRANSWAKHLVFTRSYFHHQALSTAFLMGTPGAAAEHGGNLRRAALEGMGKIDALDPTVLRLVRNGMTAFLPVQWEATADTRRYSNPSLLDRLSKSRDIHEDALFAKLGAGLKVKAAVYLYHEWVKQATMRLGRLPTEAEMDDLAARVGQLTNANYGGLHLKRMGRDPVLQDIARLLLMAPDWTEGNYAGVPGTGPIQQKLLREGQLMPDVTGEGEWKKARFYLKALGLLMATSLLTSLALNGWDDTKKRLFNWLRSVKLRGLHTVLDTPFFSVRINPLYRWLAALHVPGVKEPEKDILLKPWSHFEDPLKPLFALINFLAIHPEYPKPGDDTSWVTGKFSPAARGVSNLFSKSNWMGQPYLPAGQALEVGRLTHPNRRAQPSPTTTSILPTWVVDQLQGSAPVPAQNFLRAWEGETDWLTAALRSSGAKLAERSDSLERTAAEEEARALAGTHIPVGDLTARSVAAQKTRRAIFEQATTDLDGARAKAREMLRAGDLTRDSFKSMMLDLRLTPLERSFDGLGINDALKVWDVATPEEKRTLRHVLVKKGHLIGNQPRDDQPALRARWNEALGRPATAQPVTADNLED